MKWIGAIAVVVASFGGGVASAALPPQDKVETSFQLWAMAQGQQVSDVACVVTESSATCYGTTADGSVLGATASVPGLAWVPITGSATTTEQAPTTTMAVQSGDNDHLFTSGEINIPAGQPDAVVIVMQGAMEVDFGTHDYVRSSFPMIVRNNTGETVTEVRVTGTARDSTGTVVATSMDFSGFMPTGLEAGDWAMGDVTFHVPLSGAVTFEFAVTTFDQGSTSSHVELVVEEATLLGDRVVGTVRNPSTTEASEQSSVRVACFADGQLVDVAGWRADPYFVEPGETASFTISLETSCSDFALAASGLAV